MENETKEAVKSVGTVALSEQDLIRLRMRVNDAIKPDMCTGHSSERTAGFDTETVYFDTPTGWVSVSITDRTKFTV